MKHDLGAQDREKLDEYFTSVRELEQRLAQAAAWSKKPKPKVNAKPPVEHPKQRRPCRQDPALVRPDPPRLADRLDASDHAGASGHQQTCRRFPA